MNHQKFIDEKIAEIAKEKVVLDVGGGAQFQKWLAPYKELFRDCDYKTLDMDATSNPDIVGDVHNIPLPDESVDAVLCHSLLEHVQNPIKAAAEMSRVLKKGGKLFGYVPSIYPYHARPGIYPDYWRFFDDTLKFLFKDFKKLELAKRGGYFTALSFFIPYRHKLTKLADWKSSVLDKISGTEKRSTTAGYYFYAIK